MGWWATHAVQPSRSLPSSTLDIPPPRMVQCVNCESSFVLLPAQDLPPRWKLIEGELVCADCAPSPKESLRARPGRMPTIDQAKHKPIGAGESRYRGFRIGHEIVLGFAAIQIRGGASQVEDNGTAVEFMLDAQAIDNFIIELSTIRAELIAAKLPCTAAGEGRLS